MRQQYRIQRHKQNVTEKNSMYRMFDIAYLHVITYSHYTLQYVCCIYYIRKNDSAIKKTVFIFIVFLLLKIQEHQPSSINFCVLFISIQGQIVFWFSKSEPNTCALK